MAALNSPSGRRELGTTNLTIGRAADNQLVVNDSQVSWNHAEIHPERQGYSIIDLGSTNGTFVNEYQITSKVPHPLNHGDRLRFGRDMNNPNVVFTYEVSGAVSREPTVHAGASQREPTIFAQPAGTQPNTAYGGGVLQNYQAQGSPPPPPGYPNYNPPQTRSTIASRISQPQKLWITLGIAGGALLIVAIFLTVFLQSSINSSTPSMTLDAFCNGIQKGDTHTAYTQFSSDYQKQITESEFTSAVSDVATCSHSSIAQSGATANATLALVHSNGSTNNDVVTLVQDSNGNWKIVNLHSLR